MALVTGSASFLGGAICRKFSAQGFDLALHYRGSRAATLGLARELERMGSRSVVLRADLSNEKEVRGLVPRTVRTFGRLDVLVNNASLFLPDPPKPRYGEWNRFFSVNLFAPFLLADQAAPHLKKARGSVVNLADIYGEHPVLRGHKTYSATKAALIHWTRGLARELGPEVRVNAVSPGAFFIPKTYDRKRVAGLLSKSALQRKGEPDELAEAVYFMATHPFVTGQVLKVDGGRALS